ncbi:hypothetical protein SODALDRAFT_376222 [Sodiomyces alkalinus F11]|uniref:Xylanolytic transcriptional activator regulatory domain-containing protein n=1 Tax=Sodiomyces alkalinus (strain CBS 110278 / VKM F-3762 / F11) TaxID=1314773 RepID=A0A3N2Q102_SODAK|nr:hypothetical protein SODALDRAFT_376222 [Sodiomyces alkalinus F11]ROT40439.1 hypothetical protein SODALDRAFT_376222 [Sodiomyces alkalinus F11]
MLSTNQHLFDNSPNDVRVENGPKAGSLLDPRQGAGDESDRETRPNQKTLDETSRLHHLQEEKGQGESRCSLCSKLDRECHTPCFDERRRTHTRSLIETLQAENARLKAELEDHRKYCLMGSGGGGGGGDDDAFEFPPLDQDSGTPTNSISPGAATDASPQPSTSETSSRSDNMIVRLCGGKRQLNSDRAGRLRYFGPTSSLHLMESVTSSVLIRESCGRTRPSCSWQDDFPIEVQDHLLDLYWTYQHQVLPCIQKEAFLRDMRNGDTKYCSKLLVYCMLTRAAAISDQPGLRALALADDAEDDPPYLVSKCVQLLNADLDTPGITTAQSLQLLSEMHCAISHDTKGWMYAGKLGLREPPPNVGNVKQAWAQQKLVTAGGAGRLAYELGLHRDSDTFETDLSELDRQVRRIVFWSCFNLDRHVDPAIRRLFNEAWDSGVVAVPKFLTFVHTCREWALYLGRPQFLKVEDIDAKRPGEGCENPTLDIRMSAAWTSLLDIVGRICDVLNGVHTSRHRLETLDQDLKSWEQDLDPTLHYSPIQIPAVMLLHMQYMAATILLHRPLANFGKDSTQSESSMGSEASRQICVQNACTIARYLQDYSDQYGSVLTMSWIALHIVATAATTLIANIAERGGEPGDFALGGGPDTQLESLRKCLGALSELEKSHVVTRRVRKVIQHAIRLLNLDATINAGSGGNGNVWSSGSRNENYVIGPAALSFPAMAARDYEISSFPLMDLLPSSGQFDMLNSFESYFR